MLLHLLHTLFHDYTGSTLRSSVLILRLGTLASKDSLHQSLPRGWHQPLLSPWKEGLQPAHAPSHQLQGPSPERSHPSTWSTVLHFTLSCISPSCLQGTSPSSVPLKPTCPPLLMIEARCIRPGYQPGCLSASADKDLFPGVFPWASSPEQSLWDSVTNNTTPVPATFLGISISYFGAGSVGSSAQLQSMQVLGTSAHSKSLAVIQGRLFSLIVREML